MFFDAFENTVFEQKAITVKLSVQSLGKHISKI